jgi:hypothetical protein
MHLPSRVKMWSLVGLVSIAGVYGLTQVPTLIAVPQQSK